MRACFIAVQFGSFNVLATDKSSNLVLNLLSADVSFC